YSSWSNWGNWNDGWNGSDYDNAGTPENQYTYDNTGYGGYWGYWGYGNNNNGGTSSNGSGSGTLNQGQLGDSSAADTVTVTASTLAQGFSLGDAANYGIIAFNPNYLKGSSNSPINGNVG